MGRTRRAAIDGGFEDAGNDWYDFGSFVDFPLDGYVQFSLPFSIYLGGNFNAGGNFIPGRNEVSTLTLWDNGILSLGPVTQAQIDFMQSGVSPIPDNGNPGFPGFFFLFDYAPEAQYATYSYGLGVADYNEPFDASEAVSAAFFSFDNGFQIILDQDGFSVVSEFGAPVINGFYIGGLSDTVVGGQMDYDFYPNFLRYAGTGDADTAVGSEYNETFISSAGADTIDGQGGIDIVVYSTSLSGVTVNLATGSASGGDAEGDQLTGIEELVGSDSSDTLVGSAENNQLLGLDGADIINGREGNDIIRGGAGGDTLNGGAGIDTLSYIASFTGVSVSFADRTASGGEATGDVFSGFEILIGSDGDDVLEASAAGNRLSGEFGEDTLLGGAGADDLSGGLDDDYIAGRGGADLIDGGSGFDTASYATSSIGIAIDLETGTATGGEAQGDVLTSIESLIGSSFNDSLLGNSFDNRLVGGFGADQLFGRSGNDTLLGGDNSDMLDGGAGVDVLFGGIGTDTLLGGAGSDIMTGDEGNDTLDGGTAADTMLGGLGNDTYYVDNAGDTVSESAGEGNDRVVSSINLRLAANVDRLVLTGSALRGDGNELDNFLNGSDARNILNGNGGADIISGGGGDDTIDGGPGADAMSGGGGNDLYFVDSIADTTTELNGQGLDEVRSRVDFTLGDNIEVLRLLSGGASGTGNALDNLLVADAGTAATLRGNDGNDDVFGSRQNDLLDGNAGNDRVFGNSGNDEIFGRNGNDVLEGQNGSDTLDGGAGDDVVVGGFGDDELHGGTGADRLRGEDNEDFLYGDIGVDTLLGEAGNDQLFGGDDADRLTGGEGRDRMSGGAGRDIYIFTALADFAGLTASDSDRILDFSQLDGDSIRFDGIDADTTLEGNQAFIFVGTGAFTNTAGELRFEQSASYTMVYGDTNGDGAADFALRLDGLIDLVGSDFVL